MRRLVQLLNDFLGAGCNRRNQRFPTPRVDRRPLSTVGRRACLRRAA